MLSDLVHLPSTLEECHEVIRTYHVQLQGAQSQIEELKQVVNQLLMRVEKLEVENRELRARLNSDSNNSSKPPSSDFKKNKKNKKRSSGNPSGGQKGHPGHFRQLLDENEVDEIIDCKEFHPCNFCGGEISAGVNDFVRHQVHELPKIQLDVTEYRVVIGRCQCCTRKQVARLPEGVSWGMTGPRLTSFMCSAVSKYQLSRRALKEFLKEHFNFCLSLGTVFNKQKLINRILEEPVNALLPFIKQSVSNNIDETSHRQQGQNYWLRTVASQTAAYFKITKSRGKKVLHELMEDFEHVVISDRYSAYNYFESQQRQICWAHLKRDFTRLWQKKDKMLSRIGKRLLQCESQLFQSWHQFKNSQITRDELIRQTASIVKAVGECLEQGSYTAPELKASRFCKNLLERFSSLWLFLEKEGIEPTNNHAERCLRFLVIWRKKYFATQSDYGSEYIARTASLITTAKLQKINPFHYLTQAVKAQFSKQRIPDIIDVLSF